MQKVTTFLQSTASEQILISAQIFTKMVNMKIMIFCIKIFCVASVAFCKIDKLFFRDEDITNHSRVENEKSRTMPSKLKLLLQKISIIHFHNISKKEVCSINVTKLLTTENFTYWFSENLISNKNEKKKLFRFLIKIFPFPAVQNLTSNTIYFISLRSYDHRTLNLI